MTQRSDTARTTPAYECDHMRPLIRLEDGWYHVLPEGRPGGKCGASSVYKVEATYKGEHYLSHLVRDDATA